MLFFIGAKSQNAANSDANSQIEITPYIPDQVEGLPDTARNNLENKLSQIITSNGFGVSSENSRFIITANVVILSKDITPTAPPMQAYTLGINLYIGDGIEGIKFSSCAVTLKGVGENETKAYMSALKNLKVDDPKFQEFITKAEVKIVDYYSRKCDFILKDAKAKANQGQYEEALYKLSAIPDGCKTCYDKSLPVSKVIYKQYIDNDCKIKLANAKNIWNSSQDEAGAYEAGEYLTEINPNAACYNEAKAFTDKIGAKILTDNNKAWNFRMKVYQDEVAAERASVKAAQDIALAYAKSTSVNYIVTGWW